MKTKLMISAILMAMTFFWLPGEGNNSVSAQRQTRRVVVVSDDDRRGRNRGRARRTNVYRYRNYGQYRRTQVGNRRYRLVRRPYWSNGIRRVRLTRVYY